MAQFITRVELHDATWQDYEKLHQAMESENFYRVIKGSDNKWYRLPTAEYHLVGEITASEVRTLASKAAATTGKRCSVLVSQSSGIVWLNLTEAK
jgi:hypothetical protein